MTSWLQSLPSKILHGATASNVTIMKHHPRAPTNWPCDIGTTTCPWFILFPFHLVFHPSFSNTEMRAIIPTDWSKKKKNTHLSENGGGPRSEYYCTVKSRSQQLHISQEISLSMKNHVYHKNNTRGEDLQQKQQSGPFLGKGELGSFLGCYQMEGAPMSSNENTLTLRPCILSKIHHMPSTF